MQPLDHPALAVLEDGRPVREPIAAFGHVASVVRVVGGASDVVFYDVLAAAQEGGLDGVMEIVGKEGVYDGEEGVREADGAVGVEVGWADVVARVGVLKAGLDGVVPRRFCGGDLHAGYKLGGIDSVVEGVIHSVDGGGSGGDRSSHNVDGSSVLSLK